VGDVGHSVTAPNHDSEDWEALKTHPAPDPAIEAAIRRVLVCAVERINQLRAGWPPS
jgi:hypothetical protein